MAREMNFCPECGAKLRTITHNGVTVKECDDCGWQYNMKTGEVVHLEKDKDSCKFPCPFCGADLTVYNPKFGEEVQCPHCGRKYNLPPQADPAWKTGLRCNLCGGECRVPANRGLLRVTCPHCKEKVEFDSGKWPENPSTHKKETEKIICYCRHCGRQNRVPAQMGRLSVTCAHCGGKFEFDSGDTPKAKPQQNTEGRIPYIEYMQRIFDACSHYLKNRDDESAEFVESKLQETCAYLGTGEVSDYIVDGLLGNQHLICALYYAENYFNAQKIERHAIPAQMGLKTYLDHTCDSLDQEQIRQHEVYIRLATTLHAYAVLRQDRFENIMQMLADEPVTPLILALTGTAATRLAYEYQDKDQFVHVAYTLFCDMDTRVEKTFKWKHEEDIFREAYGYLTLLITSLHESFPNETRIPQSYAQALACSQKIYALLRDEEQKQWVMEDIENYRRHLV